MAAPKSTATSPRGIYQISAEDYHADREGPTLSASIASLLCERSPRHAWTAHPRLNPDYERRVEEKFDVGTAAHAMFLEGADAVEVIDAKDWRTADAQQRRDAARANGKIPLLVHTLESVQELVYAISDQLDLNSHRADPPMFQDGKPEQTLIWHEPDGVMCRARLDWLRDDFRTVDDLKTTRAAAHPDAWTRTMFWIGADIQAAFYIRGVERLTGETPEFRWAVIETSPPYALSVISPGPDVLAVGRDKVEWALHRWRECLKRNDWPGYPLDVCYASLPAWQEARWLEKDVT